MKSTLRQTRFTTTLLLGAVLVLTGWAGFYGCSGTNGGDIPITTDSESAREHFLEGRELANNLRNIEAGRQFERAVKADPDFALAYLYLANSSNTARAFFENIRQARSLSSSASLGERLMIDAAHAAANGDQAKRLELLSELVAAYPNDRYGRLELANFYFTQQQYDSAIAGYEWVTSRWPDFAPPYNMLGYSYRSKHDFKSAANAFKEYIRLIPDDPNPYDSYAELLLRTGEFEEAIKYYQEALNLLPTFAPSQLGIASCLNMLDRHEEARAGVRAVYEGSDDTGQRRAALGTIAVSFADQGDLASAIQVFEERLAFDRSESDPAAISGTLATIAFLQLESGQPDAAEANYDRSLEVIEASDLFERVKSNARTDRGLQRALTLLARDRLDEAKSEANKYISAVETMGNIFRVRNGHIVLGRIALAQSDFETARSEFMQTDTATAWTLYHLGLAEEQAGNLEGARDYFERAANTYELNDLAYALVRRVATEKAASLSGQVSS